MSLPDPRELLARTDWAALDDWAGHPFYTPLADDLAALTAGDRAAAVRAGYHLADALLHQGSIYRATGPAALYLAALLADPAGRAALDPPGTAGLRPMAAKLLDLLAAVARAVGEAREWPIGRLGDEVRALRPDLFRGASACLTDDRRAVRDAALAAVVALLDAPELERHRSAFSAAVRQELALSAEQGYRLAAVVALRAWGEDTSALAADAELAKWERRTAEWERRRAAQPDRGGPLDEPPF